MTSSIKFIGMILTSIGLLGLTSGCGKKVMRGSSGADAVFVQSSAKPVVLAENMSASQPLADADKVKPRRAIDLGVDSSASESQANHQNSTQEGRNDLIASDPSLDLNKDLSAQAILMKPMEEVSAPTDERRLHSKGVTLSNGLQDIYFEFDSWRLTEKSRRVLEADAEWLKEHPHERITIEGHCDERGTQAYNYVLGEKRAVMVQQYLGLLGVSQRQLAVMSYGKDKPKCRIYSDNCFQQNRRAHFGSDLSLASK